MILEAGSGKSLKAVSTAPSAAIQCVSTCSDRSRSTGRTKYVTLETTFDDDPEVTIVAAPAESLAPPSAASSVSSEAQLNQGIDRTVEYISIRNMSSGAETITVKLYGGEVAALPIAEFTLATAESAAYTREAGWQTYLATGALRTTI